MDISESFVDCCRRAAPREGWEGRRTDQAASDDAQTPRAGGTMFATLAMDFPIFGARVGFDSAS